MSIRTIDESNVLTVTEPRFPRDSKGRAVSTKCPHPDCGHGTLRYEGRGFWSCDGLIGDVEGRHELEPCPHFHYDGEDPVQP